MALMEIYDKNNNQTKITKNQANKRKQKAASTTTLSNNSRLDPTDSHNTIQPSPSQAAQQTSPALRATQSTSSNSKKLVVIAGDSIIKHVQGPKISNNEGHVAVKSFSGAKIDDMEDYLKPLIRKNPDKMVLDVGTNNTTHQDPSMVPEGIANLAIQIKDNSPSTEIFL